MGFFSTIGHLFIANDISNKHGVIPSLLYLDTVKRIEEIKENNCKLIDRKELKDTINNLLEEANNFYNEWNMYLCDEHNKTLKYYIREVKNVTTNSYKYIFDDFQNYNKNLIHFMIANKTIIELRNKLDTLDEDVLNDSNKNVLLDKISDILDTPLEYDSREKIKDLSLFLEEININTNLDTLLDEIDRAKKEVN